MAEGMEKNYVQDIVNKEWLKSDEAKNAVKEGFDFTKFDEMVENSFQTFLNDMKKDEKFWPGATREMLQNEFNNWLDTVFVQLDEIKELETEKAIIMPTNFELIRFDTLRQLDSLQTEVEIQERDATVQSEIVSINGNDLHINTYKDNSWERVDKNQIAELFNKNFERRDELLNLLKVWWIDNVKKFQRIIAGLNENWSEDGRWRSTLLWRFGVDWKFGWNTMQAFQDYVSTHETAAPQPAPRDETETDNGDQDVVQASVNVTWDVVPTAPTGNPANNPNENPERVTPTSDIDNFEFEMNKKEEIDTALATKIVQKEKEAWKTSIQLENLKKITPEVAAILAGFEWELHFPSLEEINPEILKAFMNDGAKCTLVKFSWGYIENNDGKFSISINDGETFDITDENIPENIYWLLVNNTQNNTQQPTPSATTPTSSTPTGSTPSWNWNNQNQTTTNWWVTQTTGWEEWSHEWDWENPEWEETETNESIADIQIQYDADTLISWLKQWREAQSEMDALKLLLWLKMFVGISNSLSYSIEWYELKGQEKKDLKRLRSTLRLFANSHETTVTITDFFRLAAEQYSTGGNFDISKLGKEPSHRWTKKSYEKFWELYSKYRRQEWGPYFKKVMWIMENYFLRGNVDEKSIRDLYQMENIWTWEGFIDPEKEREVLKWLFDWKDIWIDLWVPYQSSEQLKTLKKIVKKIDLNELFKSGKLDWKWNNLGKREKQFYDLYQSYKKWELQGDNYYKKVFEFLVWAWRWNTTIVDAINAVNLTRIAKVDFDAWNDWIDTKDEIHYNSEEEKKFILLLSDFNHDARVDWNDNWLKMWQQLRNIYKSINIDLNNAWLDDQLESWWHVRSNILSFAKQYLNNTEQGNIASKLDWISSVEELNQKIKDDPTILIALQNMLKNSSISINSICRYGDKATEMFMKELMQDQKMDEQFNKVFEGLVAQWVNPTAKQALKPIILWSLMDNSVWLWLWAAYDAWEIWSFSAVLWVADVPWVWPTAWLVVWYWNAIPVWENRSIDLWASGGVSYTTWFVPMFSVYAWASRVVSNWLMRDDFDATTLTKIHAWANFTMIWTIPSRWLSAWVSMDKLSWIDKQEGMLRPQITSVISEFLNDTEITWIVFGNNKINEEQKEKCISKIREKLGEKYWKMDEDLLDKAANNLYMWFAYYAAETNFANASEQDKKAIINKITNNIVNNYVTQRRNDKIEELNWKTTVSDVTVWVQFLAGYYPIPMMWITFTKYSNLYSRETPESIAEYESILSTGQWMWYLERSVDENWNILPAAITYLNQKLSIASRYDLNAMQIQFKEITDNNEVKNIVFIPRELCNSVNIFADAKMKDFIKSTEEWFEIPVNTELSLLTYTRTDATKFDLIIWDYKKEDGDITINITSKFEWDPLKYEKENWILTITPHKINADMESLYQDPDFPLSQCTEIKDGKYYFETRWAEIQCSWDGVSMENWKLAVSARAMLLIKRKADWTYTAECNAYGKWFETNITYIDEKKNGETEVTQSLENLFEWYNELNAIFDGIEKQLSLMDNWNNWAYATFMNAAADANLDNMLDNSDYEAAFAALSNLLNWKLRNSCFDWLRWKLANATTEEKVMIVDRFKAIFSFNDNLVNKHNLELQLRGRWNGYKELYWYDRTTRFPLTSDIDYRKAVQEKLNSKWTFGREPNPNLIGMTAFYRLWQNNVWRSYMMTELWSTNVLGWEMIPITETNDLTETKKWFINNLEKSWAHKELLKASLSAKLKSMLNIENVDLSNENLISILQWNDIDIWGKKVKIEAKYVFYLLWECANESIWLNLENIVVSNNATTITISPEKSYEWVSGVYVWSAEASSRYEIWNSNSATLGLAFGRWKATETEQVIDKDHTEPGENIDPNSDHTEVWENINPTNNNEWSGISLGGGNGEQTQEVWQQQWGWLFGRWEPVNNEWGSLLGREPIQLNEWGGIVLGWGQEIPMEPGTYTVVNNTWTHVITITETEDSYIVHTVTTPLPQHGHALASSQSQPQSETRVFKKEK